MITNQTGIRIIESRFRSSDHQGDSSSYEAPVVIHDSFTEQEVRDLSMLAGVKSVMSMGSVLSIELIQTYVSVSAATIANTPDVMACTTTVIADNLATSVTSTTTADQHNAEDIGTLMIMDSSICNSYNNIHSDNDSDGPSHSIRSSSSTDDHSSEAPLAATHSVNNAVILVTLLRQERIYARPLGNTVYLMPTPLTSLADRQRLVRVLRRCIIKAFYIRSTNLKASTAIV